MGNLNDGVFCLQDLNQKRLFCATVTGAVVQVNYGKRQLERVFQLHDGKINDLRVAEGFAVTASDDKFLRVWPTDFSDFFLEAEHESAVTSCSVSSDGLQVCASTSTGSLGVLDIPSHAYRTLLRSHAGAVTSAAFDPSPDRDEVSLFVFTHHGRFEYSSYQMAYSFERKHSCRHRSENNLRRTRYASAS